MFSKIKMYVRHIVSRLWLIFAGATLIATVGLIALGLLQLVLMVWATAPVVIIGLGILLAVYIVGKATFWVVDSMANDGDQLLKMFFGIEDSID